MDEKRTDAAAGVEAEGGRPAAAGVGGAPRDPSGAPGPSRDGRGKVVLVVCVAAALVVGAFVGVWASMAGGGPADPTPSWQAQAPSSGEKAPSGHAQAPAAGSGSSEAASGDAQAPAGASDGDVSVTVDVDGRGERRVTLGVGASALDALRATGAQVEADASGQVTSVDGVTGGTLESWRVEINDRPAQPSQKVSAGDVVEWDLEDAD